MYKNAISGLIIVHSSAPECWRTDPNAVKPSHQALLFAVLLFAPPTDTPPNCAAIDDQLEGLGTRLTGSIVYTLKCQFALFEVKVSIFCAYNFDGLDSIFWQRGVR